MNAETDAAVKFLRTIALKKGVEPTFEDRRPRFERKQLEVLLRELRRQELMVRKKDAPALPDPIALDEAIRVLRVK